MKFAFIHAEKANFPVAALCRVFSVTRQGYYAFRSRPAPELRAREISLREQVRQIHAESRGTYGSPRVHHALKERGIAVGKSRVERTLKILGLGARVRRRFRQTTKSNPNHAVAPRVLRSAPHSPPPSTTNDGRPKRWVVVRPPAAQTGLLLARADGDRQLEAVGDQYAGRVGLFLRVDDFDATRQRMLDRGVEFVTEPRDEPYGRVAVFLDVSGNRWDLLGTPEPPTRDAP